MQATLMTLILMAGAANCDCSGGSNDNCAAQATKDDGSSRQAEGCANCEGDDGDGRGGHSKAGRGALMPQSCYGPAYGCYPGNDRRIQRYPAFHGNYYRRPYNYRNLFDYPWHAGLHEPTSLFSYNTAQEANNRNNSGNSDDTTPAPPAPVDRDNMGPPVPPPNMSGRFGQSRSDVQTARYYDR